MEKHSVLMYDEIKKILWVFFFRFCSELYSYTLLLLSLVPLLPRDHRESIPLAYLNRKTCLTT